MILVDTNVLIDLRDRDQRWEPWSARTVAIARLAGAVVTSAITVGELASRGGNLAELKELCTSLGIETLPLSVDAGYRAGQAQRAYRQKGRSARKVAGRLSDRRAGVIDGCRVDDAGSAYVSQLLPRTPSHHARD